MKNTTLIQVLAILFITLSTSCAPSYFGKTYPATQNVDVYLDAADVKKAYTTIGNSSFDQGFKSLDATQQKVTEMGKAKGADGVIMKLTEEVASTTQSGSGVVTKKAKRDIITSSSTTMDVKKKKINATYIKYN